MQLYPYDGDNPNYYDCAENEQCSLDVRCANYPDCKRSTEKANFITPRSEVDFSDLVGTVYLSIPKEDIPRLAAEYCEKLETEPSDKWCNCDWALHPDDENLGPTQCSICAVEKENHIPEIGSFDHNFRGRRKRLVNNNETCPVHTREGRIMGFFDWVFGNAK